MSDIEFAGLGSFSPKLLMKFPFLSNFRHARIAFAGSRRMPLTDEEVSVGGEDDIVWLVEEARSRRFVPLARLPLGAQREQNFSLWAELHHGVGADVGGPDVAVLVDAKTVAARKQPFAEGSNEFSVLIELRERLQLRGLKRRDGPSNRTRHWRMRPCLQSAGTGSGIGNRDVI